MKQYKTPFIIAANKIDKISGWQQNKGVAKTRIESQRVPTKTLFEEKLYELIGIIYDKSFESDIYYNVKDI